MKKIFLIAAVGMTILSCEKEGTSTNDSSGDVESGTLTQDEKSASYAYGVSLGQNTERYNKNPQLKDSLDFDEVNKGIKEYLDNPENLASYTYGLTVGQQIQGALDNKIIDGHLDKDQIVAGMMDYLNKKDLKISTDSVSIVMDNFYKNRVNEALDVNKKKGIAFMNEIKQEEGVQTTDSGIAYKVIKEGEGEKPEIGDKVKVKYTGTFLNGEVFDSTDKNNNGEAIDIGLNPGGLISGWIEAIQLMPKGSKYKFYIPSDLAYGDRASGNISPGETLIFDIELIDFTKGEAPQVSPAQTQPGVKIKTN